MPDQHPTVEQQRPGIVAALSDCAVVKQRELIMDASGNAGVNG
ncbi:hypothetical protein [Roseiflexus castenholzii]|nr:hypothetical protein [Roseiflexus castenholzii]